MRQKFIKSPFLAVIAISSLILSTFSHPALATALTISQDGPNVAVDQNVTVTASEWSLEAQASPVANTNGSPANVSLVFGYTDADNYYYVNYSAADAEYMSGVYKVTAGIPSRLQAYATRVTAGQTYNLEVRMRSGTVKLYMNGTYLTKATIGTLPSSKVGVGTVHGNATFDGANLDDGSDHALSPTPVGVTLPPTNPGGGGSLPPTDPGMPPSIGRQVNVATSEQLKAAILDARPGDTITMADGIYESSMLVGNYTGSFAITNDGTADNAITLRGSRNAIIRGNGIGGRYGLYLYGANHWNFDGFTVADAAKGIVLDGSNHAYLHNLKVTNVGQEAVHFRAFSSDNVIKNSEINATGRKSAQYGEGVYIGSANSNWGTYTGGQPDTSDRNQVIGNSFTDFTAEAIDLKEGSSFGYVAGNTFEGSSISGQNSADSWLDAKGNDYLIENNVGTNTLLDGFQVHTVYSGWGARNVFKANTANVNASGYGISVNWNSLSMGNVVYCSNVATGAGSGMTNVTCTP